MIKPGEMAQRLGVTVRTLQAWDRKGLLVAKRTPTNRRYYTERQCLDYLKQNEPKKSKRKRYAYARVSNAGQKDDLKNQIDFLRNYANGEGIILDDVLTDIGSGLNYERKEWSALLEKVMKGEVETIYVTFKDRFVRFGYDWFEQLCQKFNTEIVVLNNQELSPRTEMVEDLVSIINVFSCRIYGLRKYQKQIEEDASVTGIPERI